MSKRIDIIYHNATAMHHIAPYSALKAANVDGIKTILSLACTYKLKPVHYSSTLSIFSQLHDQPELIRIVDEYSDIEAEKHMESQGYTASKWVAEKIVMQARKRGIPCNIYRFGLVTGDSKKGRYDSNQWLYRLLASCIQSGFYPSNYKPKVALTPVDYSTRALVYLSLQETGRQWIFHLDNPFDIKISKFFKIYNKKSEKIRRLQGIPYDEWLNAIKEVADIDHSISIYPLLRPDLAASESKATVSSKGQQSEKREERTGVLCQQTLGMLDKGGVNLPNVNNKLLYLYLKHIRKSIEIKKIEENMKV